MPTRTRTVAAAGASGFLLLALTAGTLFAQQTQAPPSAMPPGGPASPTNHEQMHAMMDAMHGTGAGQRMHEAMGPDAENAIDRCAATMGTMPNLGGMMGGGMAAGATASGMMDGSVGQSMQGMMARMMGGR